MHQVSQYSTDYFVFSLTYTRDIFWITPNIQSNFHNVSDAITTICLFTCKYVCTQYAKSLYISIDSRIYVDMHHHNNNNNWYDCLSMHVSLSLRISGILLNKPTDGIGKSISESLFVSICLVWGLILTNSYQVDINKIF